jgi:hypothetical protein
MLELLALKSGRRQQAFGSGYHGIGRGKPGRVPSVKLSS